MSLALRRMSSHQQGAILYNICLCRCCASSTISGQPLGGAYGWRQVSRLSTQSEPLQQLCSWTHQRQIWWPPAIVTIYLLEKGSATTRRLFNTVPYHGQGFSIFVSDNIDSKSLKVSNSICIDRPVFLSN